MFCFSLALKAIFSAMMCLHEVLLSPLACVVLFTTYTSLYVIILLYVIYMEGVVEQWGSLLMHQSFVTTAPDPRGPGIAAKMLYLGWPDFMAHLPFIYSFVRASVTFMNLPLSFPQSCMKVTQAGYISQTTHQKAFIFTPCIL